jgi:hypothetical protein
VQYDPRDLAQVGTFRIDVMSVRSPYGSSMAARKAGLSSPH